MAREFGRPERVADFLLKELSGVMQREMRDPRVGLVSVTDVEVSRDLSHAKVYVTILGVESVADAKDTLQVLNKAVGFFRSHIAKQSTMRIIPNLRFFFDESVFRGQQLSALIDDAVKKDQAFQNDEGDDAE